MINLLPGINNSGMNIYYLARNIYQYSYVKSLYREIGGTFLNHKPRIYFHLKSNFRAYKSKNPSRGWFGMQPKTRYSQLKNYQSLSGALLTTIQLLIKRDPEKLVTINVGHGTGYKPPLKQDKSAFDYYFIDGPMRLEKLKGIRQLSLKDNQIVKIGNLRFDDAVNGNLDRRTILKNFGVTDITRKNITYAPTWEWGGGTLLKYGIPLIQELAKNYNLFIRPHYYDWRNMGEIRLFINKERIKNIYLVEPWNIRTKDTMENLFITDLLISDNSSIAYQSLIFQTPILLMDVPDSSLISFKKEFDLRAIVDHWNGQDNIGPLIKDNISNNKYAQDLKVLLNNCFYFNDGLSTSRAIEALHSIFPGN